MGVISTDEWLKESFDRPLELCEKSYPNAKNPGHFYQYARKFGMYRPSRKTYELFLSLKEQKAWDHIQSFYDHYRVLWQGPDVKLYIFPVEPIHPFITDFKGRSGLTFPDSIFLFLSPVKDVKLWESLVVHEYHHAVRMNRFQKDPKEYHLLDSLVFEGLAEQAVRKYCGKSYNAEWMDSFSRDQLQFYWKRFFEKHLYVKKDHPLHDDLLFGGKRGLPAMTGYAIGSEIVKGYKPLTVLNSFELPSEKFLLESNAFLD